MSINIHNKIIIIIQYKNRLSKGEKKYKYFEINQITFQFPFLFMMKNKRIIKKIIVIQCNITNKWVKMIKK